VHLAWNAEHPAYWTAADNDAWADGTIALARSFAEQGGQRLVAAGTCAEYDWTDLSTPCREEETPCRPQTPYGRAKLRAGIGVMKIARETGLSAAWGRLFFLYGPGEDPQRIIPFVARQLAAGERAKVSAGTQVRDFLHVSDAATAFVVLLSDSLAGPVNIGSAVGVTIRSVVETLARMAGRPDLVDLGAVPLQPGEPPMIVADNRRLLSTGWRQKITLEAGLAEMIQHP
jgi:nucleoside-diphosphate-sugar epimerase